MVIHHYCTKNEGAPCTLKCSAVKIPGVILGIWTGSEGPKNSWKITSLYKFSSFQIASGDPEANYETIRATWVNSALLLQIATNILCGKLETLCGALQFFQILNSTYFQITLPTGMPELPERRKNPIHVQMLTVLQSLLFHKR